MPSELGSFLTFQLPVRLPGSPAALRGELKLPRRRRRRRRRHRVSRRIATTTRRTAARRAGVARVARVTRATRRLFATAAAARHRQAGEDEERAQKEERPLHLPLPKKEPGGGFQTHVDTRSPNSRAPRFLRFLPPESPGSRAAKRVPDFGKVHHRNRPRRACAKLCATLGFSGGKHTFGRRPERLRTLYLGAVSGPSFWG